MTRPPRAHHRRTALVVAFAALASVLSLVAVVGTTSVASAERNNGLNVISAGDRHTCAITDAGAAKC